MQLYGSCGRPSWKTPKRYFIAEGFFTAEEDQRVHAGTKVTAANGDVGSLVGPFGKAGKSKVAFAEGTDAAVGSKLALVLGSS